jgi:hypothetical protein
MLKEFIAANPGLTPDEIVAALNKPSITPFEAFAGKGQKATREAVDVEIAKAAEVKFDQRALALSLNVTPQSVAISCRVTEAAIVDGRVRTGDALATIHSADARNAKLADAERAFVDAVLSAANTLTEAL